MNGMFGPQQLGPLAQLLNGWMPGIEGEGLSPDPYAKTFPEQYPAIYGQPLPTNTLDLNNLPGLPPQNPGAPGAFLGLPPEILRMLLAPRQI